MAPNKATSELDYQEEKLVIKDLEALLKRSFDDDTLQVIDYNARNLLPSGENYCSVLVKLDVKIRRDATEETLFLAAKTPSPNDVNAVDWPLIFKKELFMYTELHPLYRELEKEAGVEENELINDWPKLVGHRNSLKDDDKVDEHSLLLMENIKFKGFYNVDRKQGLDVNHASKALSSLARYHALGIVLKQERPQFFEKVLEQAQVSGLDYEFLDRGYDSLLDTILKTPCLQKHLSVIKSSFDSARNGKLFKDTPEEPWASISHGDFWLNNMLFHKDETSGKVDEVKFVDFQMYHYTSPLSDLINFFNGSLDTLTQANHLHELIDIYYNNFVETLKRMDLDISPFTRTSFDSELKKRAIEQLPLAVLRMKFIFFEVDEDNNGKRGRELGNTIFETEASGVFEDKLKEFTDMYEKMNWF